jgi:hypothetical protein
VVNADPEEQIRVADVHEHPQSVRHDVGLDEIVGKKSLEVMVKFVAVWAVLEHFNSIDVPYLKVYRVKGSGEGREEAEQECYKCKIQN